MRAPAGIACLTSLVLSAPLVAQETPPPPPAPQAPAPAGAPAAPAAAQKEWNEAEIDYTVINLPTTLRLPRYHLALRITHRFSRPLGQGSFSDLASDGFGFDSHAQIGIGLRFGLTDTTQFAVQRQNERTIELSGQQEIVRQARTRSPVGIAALASVQGLNNFQQDYSPQLGVVVSRTVGEHGALYLVPMWVARARVLPPALTNVSSSTWLLGMGARVRVLPAVSLVGEYTPRVGGFTVRGSRNIGTFGIEGQVGGHCFQLNFSNDLGTTPAQLARGQEAVRAWFIGFNLTRKFL